MAGLSKPYSIRLNQAKAEELEALALEAGLDMSKFLRGMVEDTLPPVLKVKEPKSSVDDRKRAIYEMNKCGNNLNQLARSINTLFKLGVLEEKEYTRYLSLLDNIDFNYKFTMEKLF